MVLMGTIHWLGWILFIILLSIVIIIKLVRKNQNDEAVKQREAYKELAKKKTARIKQLQEKRKVILNEVKKINNSDDAYNFVKNIRTKF